MIYIKQFGLHRSGSNTLKALLEINFAPVYVLTNYAGNKHEPATWLTMAERVRDADPTEYGLTAEAAAQIAAQIAQRTLPIVFTIKEPVSWVNSYYRYSRTKAKSKNPAMVFPFNEAFCARVLSAWEANVLAWVALHDQHPRSLLFLHEEIVAGLDAQLELIRERFNLPVSPRYPSGRLAGYAVTGNDRHHGDALMNERITFNREYHLGGGWRQDIPPEVLPILDDYRAAFFRRHPRIGTLFARSGATETELSR